MNPNEFGLYMIILPHEARFCTIFGKIFKENEKSQPLWLTLNDLYFALNMDFQRKKPIFAYKTSYFQFGTLKYIDVFPIYGVHQRHRRSFFPLSGLDRSVAYMGIVF